MLRLLVLTAALAALAGCTCNCKKDRPEKPATAVARSGTAAATTQVSAAPAGFRRISPVVSFDARETPLRDVLASLSAQTGQRIVAEPKAQDLPITLRLHEVGLGIALDLLCERYKLELESIGATGYTTEPVRVTFSS